MIISLIAALDKNNVIGADGEIPWRLPADLAYFKATTMGKPLIMGRKTYESIGRPLPGRKNIVLTRQPRYEAPGCIVVHTPAAALTAASPGEEVMVIGGEAVYEAFLPHARRLYLTRIDATFSGDTYFPAVDGQQWQVVSEKAHPPDPKNPYPYRFLILERSGQENC